MQNFRTHSLSVTFYRWVKNLQLECHVRNQLQRASLSIGTNLAEGYGRRSPRDKCHFYVIAMGSIRECQSILEHLASDDSTAEGKRLLDQIAAGTYKLIQAMERKHSPSK